LDYLIHSFKVAFTDEWCCFASAETKAERAAIRSYAEEERDSVSSFPAKPAGI
jgi:hypothetical protein